MTRSFAVTWDYRCPFARNAHEHLVTALEAGADWDVTFVPFSLSQVHVEEGQAPVWEDPDKRSGLLGFEAGIVVRDKFPDLFGAAHIALFRARHDEARDLRDKDVVRDVLEGAGVDADTVFSEIAAGWPLEDIRTTHERLVADHRVFGVPTFIANGQAVFVRFMNRPHGDVEVARRTVDRTLDLLTGFPELNEFKHTSVRR